MKERRRPLSEVLNGNMRGRRGEERTSEMAPTPPPVAVKKEKEKERRGFSSIIRFFRGSKGGRS